LGIRESSGAFCVMLVQDAVPVRDTWLKDLTTPFSDDRVVGVTGRHLARADSDPFGRWQQEYRNGVFGEGTRIQELADWSVFATLGYEDRLRLVSFDNVCSAIRREFWDANPFRPQPFAEDLDWGVRAIASGKRLVYNPSILVVHSHNRPAAYHMRRSYISGRIVPKLLDMKGTNPGVRNDEEFFAVSGFLFGAMRTILSTQVKDWRGFLHSCAPEPRVWESILRAMGMRPPPPSYMLNSLQGDLDFVLDQLKKHVGTKEWNSTMVQVLGEVSGSFAASYYNWCEAQGCVSEGMRRLDKALAEGV